MEGEKKRGNSTAVLFGVAASVLFLCVFIPTVNAIGGAQSGAALLLSPLPAGWAGVSVWYVARGLQFIRVHHTRRKGAIYILIGLAGIAILVSWFAGEVWQATHPTRSVNRSAPADNPSQISN